MRKSISNCILAEKNAVKNYIDVRIYKHRPRGGYRISSLGGALKKIAPSGARRENFWGISCEKNTILRQKIIFFPIAEGGAKIFGVFRVKNYDFTPKNHIYSNFRGGARRAPPPLDPPLRPVSKRRLIPSTNLS
jgi:hypothetical protein